MIGVVSSSVLSDKIHTRYDFSTGFLIAANTLLTTAHSVHFEGNLNNALHQRIELKPYNSANFTIGRLIAEDTTKDIALVSISDPVNLKMLALHSKELEIGTSIGSIGYPNPPFLSKPEGGILVDFSEKFQGAFIASSKVYEYPQGIKVKTYETDSIMYGGSSGSPGFTGEGNIFGMHQRSVQTPNGERTIFSDWIASQEIIAFAQQNGISDLLLV
jgi:V8-like Glu-specific endopeptidase